MRPLARPLVLGGILLVLLIGVTGSVAGGRGPVGDVAAGTVSARTVAARTVAARAVARSALAFQPEGGSRFAARTPGHGVAVSPEGATVAAGGDHAPVRLRLHGANPDAPAEGRRPLAGRANQFLGDDPSAWQTDVATYGQVAYAGVWNGVDVVWYGSGSDLEQDFVVGAGADPGQIGISFPDAGGLRIDDRGDLVVALAGGEARLRAPVLYQGEGRGRRAVAGGFVVGVGGVVGFRVGAHDAGLPLVIDPVLVESTFLGGGGDDAAYGVAVDAAGGIYVTGSTESVDFPVAGPVQNTLVQDGDVRTDAFVTKLSPDGSAFTYSTFLGGKGRDIGYAIAVGADGSATVSGSTESTDFPTARPVQKAYGGGATDAFVTRLGPQGAVLAYSSYLGGGGADVARGVAVDVSGNATLAGTTTSNDFPIAGPALQGAPNHPDDTAAFVTRVNADGSAWAYSTYLGGSGDDRAAGVALDASGAAVVVGETQSPDFPTAKPIQAAPGLPAGNGTAASDAFVVELAPAGSPLVYATYLGGSAADKATGVAVDPTGAAYVTGQTSSPNFPAVKALQNVPGGSGDAFVTKVDPTGTSLVWSSFLGGSAADSGAGITVTADGRASVTGATASDNFPVAKPVRQAKAGFTDAFVATFAPSGGALSESTYLGGTDEDQGTAIAADRAGTVFVAGNTRSLDFPLVAPIRTTTGRSDAFLATVGEASASASSAGAAVPARERRIRILGAVTVVLFLAAIAQTLWLRRRPTPAPPDPVAAVPGLGVLRSTQPDPQWYAPKPPRLADLPPLRPRAVPPPVSRRGRKSKSEDADPDATVAVGRSDVAVPELFPDNEEQGWSREQDPDDTEFWSTDDAPRPGDERPARPVDVQAPDLWDATEAAEPAVVGDVRPGAAPPAAVDVSAPDLWAPTEPEEDATVDPMWADLLAEPATPPPTAPPQEAPAPETPPQEAAAPEAPPQEAPVPEAPVPEAPVPPAPAPEPVSAEAAASGDWMADLWPEGRPAGDGTVPPPDEAPTAGDGQPPPDPAEAEAVTGGPPRPEKAVSDSATPGAVSDVFRGWRARRRAAADQSRRASDTPPAETAAPQTAPEPAGAAEHAEAHLVDAGTPDSASVETDVDWEAPVLDKAPEPAPAPAPPIVPAISEAERPVVEAGLADLVTNVELADLPAAAPWALEDFDGPLPAPHDDPALAAALARELSISDLLDEDLPIPASTDGGHEDELSMRDLLAEDLQFSDADTATPAGTTAAAWLPESDVLPPPEAPAPAGEVGSSSTPVEPEQATPEPDPTTDGKVEGEAEGHAHAEGQAQPEGQAEPSEEGEAEGQAQARGEGESELGGEAEAGGEAEGEPVYPKLPEARPGRWETLRSGWGRPRH